MGRRYQTAVGVSFACFVFYRVWSALWFDPALSLSAALISGAVTGWLFFYFEKWATLHYGIGEMQKHVQLPIKGVRNPLFTHIPLFALANTACGLLVAIGFSEQFVDYNLDYIEHWLLFSAAFAVPSIALYSLSKAEARRIMQSSIAQASANKGKS